MRSGFECRTEAVWESWWRCLSNVLHFSSRWLKRAPQCAGQVSAFGLVLDHSKDDTMSSSEIRSELMSNLRIIAAAAAAQSLPFIWSTHKSAASLQFSALLFYHPSSTDTRLQPLQAAADAGRELKNQCTHAGKRGTWFRTIWAVLCELFIR